MKTVILNTYQIVQLNFLNKTEQDDLKKWTDISKAFVRITENTTKIVHKSLYLSNTENGLEFKNKE